MASAPLGLFDLLLALFSDESDLDRFLALTGKEEAVYAIRPTKGGGFTEFAYQVASALERGSLIDAPFFAALANRAPDRADDVWAAAFEYGIAPDSAGAEAAPADPVGAPAPPAMEAAQPPNSDEALPSWTNVGEPVAPAGTSPGDSPLAGIPSHYAAFAADLASELAESGPVPSVERCVDDHHLPWTGAAAVLGSFWPTDLRPLEGAEPDPNVMFEALAGVVVRRLDGRWVLEDHVRAVVLESLRSTGRLAEALDANRELDDPRRDWIDQLVSGARPTLADKALDALTDLEVVCEWLQPLELELPIDAAAIGSARQRRALIEPLQSLVGSGFRGRAKELDQIRRHISGQGVDRDLVVVGAGGVGKSSLVGKVLLELEGRDVPQPFAYLDFDRARNDPTDRNGLVREIALQLRTQYATSVEASRGFAGVEAVSAGSDVDLALDVLGGELQGEDFGQLLSTLARRVERLPRAPDSPMVLVLDTFEEVQVRGVGAVDSVHRLITALAAELPELCVIVCGRGAIPQFASSIDPEWDIELGDLDRPAADAVLQHAGVADPRLRELIFDRFGGNPLTLRLAATAARQDGAALTSVFEQAGTLAQAAVEQVQGMLYSRILGHLDDKVVVKVAYPGLVVRRVDVAIIRDVLAEPCDLDPDDADEIFERLQRHVALFNLDERGALVHRQDVRRLMLRAMQGDPKHAGTALEIHRRAADHYAGDPDPRARAEHVYHRLMARDDPRELGPLWSRDLVPLLAPAWEEPLPPAARRWLGPRIGRADRSERDEWELEEWEVDAAMAAESWLASGEPERALEMLGERDERLAGSRLYALEARAHAALGAFDEAIATVTAGMESATAVNDLVAQFELAEAAIELELERDDHAGSVDVNAVVQAAELAARLSDLVDEPLRGMSALSTAVEGLRGLGVPEAGAAADRLAGDLETRFLAASREDLDADAPLVRRVLRAVGSDHPAIVARVALDLGGHTDVASSAFRDDSFAVERLLSSLPTTAAPALDRLASDLGLDAAHWDPGTLARATTRLGRTSQAVLLALDEATDQVSMSGEIVANLVRSPGEGLTFS